MSERSAEYWAEVIADMIREAKADGYWVSIWFDQDLVVHEDDQRIYSVVEW